MNTNTMNKQEKSIAEKLNQLTNINTFWDDVRKHTTKSMSTATMRKWEYLADRRYAEILTGVEDVRAEVEEYGKPMRYYAPDGKEVFPKSTEKRSATKCKDSNGKEILTGMIIRISNAENKSDNGLFFVAESPCDLSWKNQTVHVLRKIDEYGVELNYVSFYPLISFDENGNEITLHSDAEIVEITDIGFSEINQYFINKKMQANIKWNHTLNCFETLENLKKRDEEILFYSEVIENIKNGFAPTTEKPTNTEEQPTMENPIEEPAPVAENSIDINAFLKKFNENYEFLYEHHDNVAGYSEALESGNAIIASGTEKSQALIKAYIDTMHDFISSDREIAALAFTLDDLGILDEYLPTVEKSINKKEQPESKGESIMNENKNNTMPNGNHLDINGKEITTGAVVEIRNAYFKNDNGFYFVEHSPSDPTWNGTTHSLIKLCRNGKISTTKYNIAFYPLATFTNSREKRIEAAEHNSKYAEIEIVDFSNMENVIAHFREELAQQKKTSQRNICYGENSDICNRDKEIEEFLQSVIDRISGKSEIIDDNDIKSMHNTENLTAETPVTEQPEEPKTAWTGRADYAERRAEKAERYAERAEKARATADRLQKPINDMHGDIAFFTQPNINTSAGRAFTRQREKMFASYEKGFEERAKAEYYDEKSENLSKEPTAISSDDPEALRKLKDKLEKLTAEHKEHLAHNKALNKAIKDGTAETNKFGWATLNGKSYYFTTNEAAEIRRLKDRIEELENLEVPEDYEFDGGTVVFNTAENRVQILFDEIPSSETRGNLKCNGFKWSPRQQAWQRMLNTTGIRTVKRLYPMPEKPTEENSVEETSQPATENIVYPFILIDTPTAQPETAEEKTFEEQSTENYMTREEILQAIEEETKASINPQQILFYGEKLLKSIVWVDGIRNKIAEIAFWKYGTGADKDFEILTIEVDRIQQNVLDSLFKKETTAEESPVEEQPVENPAVTQPITTEQKFNETLAEKEKQCDLLNEMYQKHYDVDRPDEYYAAWGKLAEINKQLSELEARAYEEMKQSSVAEETITVEDAEIAVEKIPELGLKTDEEMHKTFNAVQGKINEVGTIEQKNIIYKIPWGIYRRYSAEDITNIVLTRTNDILAIKTENRLKAVSVLIDSVTPMTTNKAMKLIADNMEKPGATVEQIAQAEIAIQYIGNPNFRQKLNDYVFAKTYKTEENTSTDSIAIDSETSAQWKIRPPPMATGY